MTQKSADYYAGYQDALSEARNVVAQYAYHAGDGWAEVNDTVADLTLELNKKLQGNVAQMVTQRPAKASAVTKPSAVGSTPTVTAINPAKISQPVPHQVALSGRRVVFTGTLHTMTREQATARNDRAGVITQRAVSGNTDYLVVAGARGSRKWNDAVAKGVPVLCEQDWYDLTK